MRESREAKRARARKIVRAFKKAYPDAKIALDFENPLELLVATILSAQCTDERVNMVTPALFEKYRSAGDYARAEADAAPRRSLCARRVRCGHCVHGPARPRFVDRPHLLL